MNLRAIPATARFVVAAASTALLAGVAMADVTLPTRDIPVPGDRPYAITANVDSSATTGSVATRTARLQTSAISGGSVARLKTGLDALGRGDVDGARAARDALPVTSLDHHILAWALATSGGAGVPSGEIAAAAAILPGWPGMAALRRNSERAMAREKPEPATVLRALGGALPLTVEGVTLLARAHIALGQADAARKVLSPFWRTERLDARDETAIIREFGRVIPAADHRFRMERMLYSDRVASAERVAGLAGANELARAWAAVVRGDKNARQLLDAVPQNQRSAGYVYALAKHLRRRDHFVQAAEIMLKAPRDRAALVDPDAWWIERRVLSRELLDIDKPQLAYHIAAAHAAESPASAVDAEFHAGWYALRFLGDAKTAASHFARIAQLSSGAISQSRAYYWLGRAAEAGGPGNARSFYAQAANHGTAFYGQLAAAKLGRSAIAARFPEPSATDRENFGRRQAVAAIRRLQDAGHAQRADILYRDLAEQLTSPGELALLAVMAEQRGNHFLALRVGKAAAARGLDVGALAHPVGAIPGTAKLSGAGMALAYAIARQESEFNVGAVSGAGARGLLQLLPGTAQEMARKSGLPYSQAKLTTDPGYNATLGAAFLTEQLNRFGGSYVLTFAGYNAGPRRAQDWTGRYGDPRGKNIDAVVDWIERIPFTETRGYVQRVMENYQVYKMRLTGSVDVVADLTHGR
jgi:soluble lytic murein transglycosylase